MNAGEMNRLRVLTGREPRVERSFFCVACGNLVSNGVTQMTFSTMTDSCHVLFVCPRCEFTNKLNAYRGDRVDT